MVEKKKSFILILCLLCIVLVGCAKRPVDYDLVTPVPSETASDLLTGSVSNLESKKTIQYYSVDSETEQKEAKIAVISEDTEITPELIMEFVLDSMEEQEIMITVDSLIKQEDTIIVSFADSTEFLKLAGKHLEDEILDSIAQSMLDNLEAYSKVIYRVMEEAYQSENNNFSNNYVYMEKEK